LNGNDLRNASMFRSHKIRVHYNDDDDDRDVSYRIMSFISGQIGKNCQIKQ